MAFFTRNDGDAVADSYGRVYVLKVVLDNGTVLHKVGMCTADRTVDRMMEILRSFFTVYRYVPYTELRKNKKTKVPYLLEQHLHSELQELQYTEFSKRFDGATEFFHNVDEDALLDYIENFDYTNLLKGCVELKEEDYNYIKAEIEKSKLKDPVYKAKSLDTVPF